MEPRRYFLLLYNKIPALLQPEQCLDANLGEEILSSQREQVWARCCVTVCGSERAHREDNGATILSKLLPPSLSPSGQHPPREEASFKGTSVPNWVAETLSLPLVCLGKEGGLGVGTGPLT